MAFFMDRHDFTGASAEDIAAAHAKDLEIQERHGVRFVSFWFDYERQSTHPVRVPMTALRLRQVLAREKPDAVFSTLTL